MSENKTGQRVKDPVHWLTEEGYERMLMISPAILLLTFSVLVVRFGSDRFPGQE